MLKHIVLFTVVTVLIAESVHSDILSAPADEPNRNKVNCIEKCKGRPMELSFVVDGSTSIWQTNFTFGLEFLEDFVDKFDISPSVVRVSLVTYGDIVYEGDAFGFNAYTNKDALKRAISQVPYRSGSKTNTSGGIWYMLNQQMKEARTEIPDLRRVVVVLTDGNSQEADQTKQAADDAAKAGLEVFAIGVGQNVSLWELHNIASDDSHVFVVSTYNMLENIKDRLRYKTCATCKMEPMDLSFVIDSSTSIGKGNFSVGMKFVKDFVDSFQINPHTVRVSAVTFGSRVYTEDAFNFEDHINKKALLDQLQGITWRHGMRTRTGDGIAYMRTEQMTQARPNIAHVCIVITDGESQDVDLTESEALQAQQEGILMYAVGVGKVGDQLNEKELNSIAGDPARVLTADSYGQLNLLKNELTKLTCEGTNRARAQIVQALRQ
ncbi:hypothetical protein ACOMHN_064540 [Nucella lapillus]